jgi:hypothetical protein
MNQHQRADSSFGDQLCTDHGLTESSWCAQYALFIAEHRANSAGLIVTKDALKVHVDRLADAAFVASRNADPVPFQKVTDVRQTTPWQRKVLSKLLAARDDPRLIPSREAHRLGFVELGILKRSDSDNPVKHRFREHEQSRR